MHQVDDADPQVPRHRARNRQQSESKLRRNPRHCPICLAELPKNQKRTRLMRYCLACQAHPSPGKRCAKCGQDDLWETKGKAACRSCGLHGGKAVVIGEVAIQPSDGSDAATPSEGEASDSE